MIRAAMIDENTGIVQNLAMITEEDISARPNMFAFIPEIKSNDGVLSFQLGIAKNIHRWDGSKFVDLQNNEVLFDENIIKKIEEYNKAQETLQVPPEVI